MIKHVDARIQSAIRGLRMAVQIVTGLVFTDDGTATGEGLSDDDLEASVGWHFGFYSRPKDGARGLVLKADGKGNTAFLIAFRDRQYELSLKKGECGMKNAFDATVLLNESGEVVLNGGTKKVARVGDATAGHVHAFGGLMCPNTGTGTPIAITGSTASSTDTINEGADKVKA